MSSRPPRFQRTLSRQIRPINPQAGAEFSAVAQELEDFTARQSATLDREAEEAGLLSGEQAGAGGEFEQTGSQRTIRGRAFNRAVEVSHQAALQTDLRDSVTRFEIENERDPDAFDAQAEGLLEGLLEEASPNMHGFIQQRWADYAGRAKTRIIARQQDALRTEAGNDLKRGADGLVEDATTAAFEGDIVMIETRRQELTGLLAEGVKGDIIEEGAATDALVDFERAVTSQEVLGNFDRLVRAKGPDAGADAIKRWQKIKPSSVGLTSEDHAAVTRQMVTLRNREINLAADASAQANAALRAETNVREGRVNDGISVLRDGFVPDAEQSQQIANDLTWLQSTGEADDIQQANELAADYDVALAIQGQVHGFKRLAPVARAEALTALQENLRKGGATADEVELLNALEKTDADVTRELDQDPRGYLRREGLVDDPALDFSSAEGLIQSLGSRDTEIGTQLTGQPVGLLTAVEADQLAIVYEQAEIEERVGLLGVLTAGAGDASEATLQQLDSKGYEQLALAGSFVMQGRGLLAREVLRGQDLLAAEPAMKPTPDSGVRSEIANTWGSAMIDSPEQRAVFLEAAYAKYAELKSRNGDLSDIYEGKIMEDALDAVLPTARFNGRRVAIPGHTTEDSFEAWTDSWDATTFALFEDEDGTAMAVPGVTAEEMLELVHDDGRLVELGNGRYGVMLVSASSGLERGLANEDGSPFMLEFPRPTQ